VDPRQHVEESEARMFLPLRHRRQQPLIRLGNPLVMLFVLVETMFWGLAMACLLFALHRIASALRTEARIKALKSMPEAYTEEQREVLVRKIKQRTLGCI
jgi:hypothetical protein